MQNLNKYQRMRKKNFTLSVTDSNSNNANLNLSSTFGKKDVTFSINGEDGKINTIQVSSEEDLNKIIAFLQSRLDAIEDLSTSYTGKYTPTGIGICVLDFAGNVINDYYNSDSKSLTKSVDDYSYQELSEKFNYDKVIFVVFTLYDGKISREMLVKVTQACVKYQIRFVVTGETIYCNPMILENVSKMIGVDGALISRCTEAVRVYGPYQSFSLDATDSTPKKPSLFGEGIPRNGFLVSRIVVMEQIEEMIEKEDKRRPLSDKDIMTRLNSIGYVIARRTVTKYRDSLSLPNSNERRLRD